MSKRPLLIMAIIFIVLIGIFWFGSRSASSKVLTSPGYLSNISKQQPMPSSSQAPPQAPKTFKFDRLTDLKAELEKINPQVLDSDFE